MLYTIGICTFFNFKKAKVWINKLKQQLKGGMFIESISCVNNVLFLHHTDISVNFDKGYSQR